MWTHSALNGLTAIFDIEDSNLSIPRSRDECSVIGVGHELDREYVGGVACGNCSCELEGRDRVLWLIRMDIEMLVVAA